MKIISLGAGVQSSALLIMSCIGDFERADRAIFSDTGWEPKSVYAHLERLIKFSESHGIPVDVVTNGNIRSDALSAGHRFASMPLFTRDTTGKVSMLRRQCTSEYKLSPILRRCRELGATSRNPAQVWIGISTDESHRMKPSRVKYARNRWPLIELERNRGECRSILESMGWPDVPKSSCIGCPFHDDHFWNHLKSESPAEFADAVEFDTGIRNNPRLRDEVFVHRSGQPLGLVQFDIDTKQQDLFGVECEGLCGV